MDRRIGAQYFTIRDFIQTIEDFDESCRKIKEIGYKIVQISGTPLGAAQMREVLDKYGLKVVTTHRDFSVFMDNLDEIIDYNKTLGCELCGVGIIPPKYRNGREGIDEFIRDINTVSKELKKAGMLFGYHNHSLEFVKIDGKFIMDRLIEETDPETVNFIVDTYWLQAGGVNPADFIRKLGKRAMAIHFKDLSINPEGYTQEIAEVGEGNLDWDAIIQACDDAGARWAMVEQDTCKRDPFECMKVSYDYLVKKGFN